MADLASIITAVATAVGTPGLTWLVMNKLSKVQITKIQELNELQIKQIQELNGVHLQNMQKSCDVCKKALEEKINDLCDDLGDVNDRQRALREKDLPDKYVRKSDCEKCEKRLQGEIEVAHKRISEYHPKPKGGGV